MVTRGEVLDALKEVKDPEIPQVDIVNLGLVYDVRIGDAAPGEAAVVVVDMTFTSMGCPAGAAFEEMVKGTVLQLEGVRDVYLNVVWDPPWTPRKATEEGRLVLESMGVRVD